MDNKTTLGNAIRSNKRNSNGIRMDDVKKTVINEGKDRIDPGQLNAMSKADLIALLQHERTTHHKRILDLYRAVESDDGISAGNETIDNFTPTDPYAALCSALDRLKEVAAQRAVDSGQNRNVADEIMETVDKDSNMRAVLDHLLSSVFIVDTSCRLVDFNDNFANRICARFNYKPNIGDLFPDAIDNEEECVRWKARLDKTLEGKQGNYVDQMIFGEKSRVFEIRSFPIIGAGKITGALVLIGDITHLQDSELQLIEKNRDLDRLNKEMDNFVYRISHDLRAPLTSIMGLINLIKLESDPEKLSKYIDLQEKSVKKLDRFIKDTINISRNTRLAISVEHIDYKELLHEVFDQFEQSDSGKGVEKKLIIEENVPFYSDRQRMLVMLGNLISNGIKFRDSHQPTPYVHVYITTNEKEATIEVRDNGIGIASEYLNKIYSMFFRASKDDPGSGLGLYIVNEIVNKLKGQISVRSKLREGTTFTLKIPNLIKRYEAVPRLS